MTVNELQQKTIDVPDATYFPADAYQKEDRPLPRRYPGVDQRKVDSGERLEKMPRIMKGQQQF